MNELFSILNPTVWNGISIVTLVVLLFAGGMIALFRGWIVLGIHHRELMAQKDREIAAREARSMEDAKSIAKFAEAATVTTVTAEVTQALMSSLRQASGAERTP